MDKKFLLADDDSDDAMLFCEALREVDPTISCLLASDGGAMLRNLRAKAYQRPDVIFLDLNMPVMDGWQCLKALKDDQELRGIPVIIYSTSTAEEDRTMAVDLGAAYFFSKPDNYNDLKKFLACVAESINGDLHAQPVK